MERTDGLFHFIPKPVQERIERELGLVYQDVFEALDSVQDFVCDLKQLVRRVLRGDSQAENDQWDLKWPY